MKKNDKIIYNAAEIEPKWQAKWQKEKIYQIDLDSANAKIKPNLNGATQSEISHEKKTPFYNLMMFPYPSAEGLHIGGVRTFVGVDIYARFNRMLGRDVFMPFGLDGFGIHAENYAMKIGENPMTHAAITEENYYRQMKESAISVDWSRTVETYKPDYYKWTQWIFTELFKSGLAYRKKSPVNFCPSCKTVLADEQVIDTKCERCSSIVVKKNLEQWFFRITEYADRLLNNIENLNWTEKVKIAQRNWIGKSQGVTYKFKVKDMDIYFEMFDSVPQTYMAQTFTVIAPEHPQLYDIVKGTEYEKSVMEFVEKIKNKKAKNRFDLEKEPEGIFTGRYVEYKPTGENIPLWVASFVIAEYGSGVVNSSAHDERDFAFAKKYNIPLHPVMFPKDPIEAEKVKNLEYCYHHAEDGILQEPDEFKGRKWGEAREGVIDFIEKKGFGKKTAQYHLRDWLISRQRYWGPPIPMIYCESCAEAGRSWFNSEHSENSENQKVRSSDKSDDQKNRMTESSESSGMSGWYPVENLPVELPFIEDFKPTGTDSASSGEVASPLGNHPEFYEVECPECGKPARRETDVSDTFLDSSWYFLRYLATEWDDTPFPSEKYIKVQKSKIKNKEEIENLKLSARGGSASGGKIENSAKRAAWLPVNMYIGGAEHSVLHLLYARFITMFLKDQGYLEFEEPFSRFYAHGMIIKEGAKMSKSKGNVVGPDLYIKKFGSDTLRMYLHFLSPFSQSGDFRDSGIEGMNRFLKRVWSLFSSAQVRKSEKAQLSSERLKMMHRTIKNVTEEVENLRFNTAIAHLMTYYNFLAKQDSISREEAEVYLKLLAPFAPHMTEELFQLLRNSPNHAASNAAAAEPERQTTQKKGVVPREVSRSSALDSIHLSPWPQYDEKYLVADTVKIAVQVNGKLRSMLIVDASEVGDKAKIEEMAKADEKVAKFLDGQKVKQMIYVPGKVLNFVVDTG